MKTLLKKELWESKWFIVITFLFIASSTIISLVEYVKDPYSFISNVSLTNTPLESFFYYNWYMVGNSVLDIRFILLIAIAYLSNTLLAKEKINNSFSYLFTRPISRFKVFITKFFAGFIAIIILVFLPVIFIPIFKVFANLNLSYLSFFIATFPFIFLWFSIFALGFLISTIANFNRGAMLITLTIPLIWDFFTVFQTIFFSSKFTIIGFDNVFINESWYYNHNIGYLPFLVGMIFIILCGGLSYFIIKKRQY